MSEGMILNRFVLSALIVLLLFLASIVSGSTGHPESSQEFTSHLRVPAYLNVGDLLFCDVKPVFVSIINRFDAVDFSTTRGFSNDHVAMYIGNNRFIEANTYLYRPLQKNWLGVVTTPFWFINMWATNITYGYVINATVQEKEQAVAWAKQQLGSPYQFGGMNPNPNPYDSEDIYSDWWFCSELVWASYYNQDVPIIISWGHYHFNASFVFGLRVADNVKMYTNIAPVADAGGPYTCSVDEYVLVNGYDSDDFDGIIKDYYWDFGDGTNESWPFVSHVYTEHGEYLLQLTVIDNAGAIDQDTTYVLVT